MADNEFTAFVRSLVGILNDSGVRINPATEERQMDGSQKTQIVDGAGTVSDVLDAQADAIANAVPGIRTSTHLYGYNDIIDDWDRLRTIESLGQAMGYLGVGLVGADGQTYVAPNNAIPTLSDTETWEALKTGNAPTLAHTFNMDAPPLDIYRYHAFAPRGTLTSAAEWTVMRLKFTDLNKEDAVEFLVNQNMAWDDRVTGGTEGWTP